MRKFTFILSLLVAFVTTAMAQVEELQGKKIVAIGDPATSVIVDQWYLLNNVGRNNIVSEETTAMKMRATSSVAANDAAEDKAGYIFKITLAEDGSHYNIMSGNGKYFALAWNASSVSETPVSYVIDNQDENTPSVFYLYDDVNKFCADGQETNNNFVGWSTNFSTSTTGNDAYRLLPITLESATFAEITYQFQYNGEIKYTQTTSVPVGSEYPDYNISFPYGVSASKHNGTVTATETVVVDLTVSLPFVPAESYDDANMKWYYLSIADAGYLLRHTDGEYIPLDQTTVDKDNKDAYSWAFIGNPFDGYKLVNRAAGEGYILSSTTNTFDGNTGGSTYPIMTQEPVEEGKNTYWIATKSSHRGGVGVFYLGQKDANNGMNRMNNRGNKLAYWNGGADSGSSFMVVERPMGPTAELEALIAEIEAMNIVAGENIADYTAESVNALNAAIETAKAIETATEADVETLQEALNSLRVVLPDPDKFYYFDCTYEGRKLYINENNQLNWSNNTYDITNSRAIFQFEAGTTPNTVKIKSVHTQSYMGAISGTISFNETGAEITIARSNYEANAVMFTTDGSTGIHANANPVIAWTNEAGSNHYVLTEVADFKHTLSVGTAEWSTLMLGFNATIPTTEGFKAYTISSVDEGNMVVLEEAIGVLGANTPIIVNAPAGNYEFNYTTDAATVTTTTEVLKGTLYKKSITPTGTAYILAMPEGADKAGLYKATLTDGAFNNNANKAYLEIEGTSDAISYGFRLPGTTSIENVTVENGVKAIFDLTGRRVESVTAPGIYIVNGKKVLVK